jgi:hypothetical protein
MGAYKRNDPELQEEESAAPAPSGKRLAPEVRTFGHKGRAPRPKRKRRSWDRISGVSATAYQILKREN